MVTWYKESSKQSIIAIVKKILKTHPFTSSLLRYYHVPEEDVDNNLKIQFKDLKGKYAEGNGEKIIPFPKGTGLYCFFSQIVECAGATGFFSLSTKNNAGELNFHIIWDGYPYFQEQYQNIPTEVFTQAKLVYDGQNDEGQRRYTLFFEEQALFFLINNQNGLEKIFWISQGFQMVKKDVGGTVKKSSAKGKKK